MGPKKNGKKGAPKTENAAMVHNIEDPINTETWKCVVVMGVERTYFDSFILKEFMKESVNKRRQQVSLIDFDTTVMEVLNQFASGELSYKYAFLLNFSPVFQEAVNYVSQKMEIPVLVLVKIVKALLFYLREECWAKIKKSGFGSSDPIKAMAERESNFGTVDPKKKEMSVTGDSRLKVRPPSVTKEDTHLLKRGEGMKYDQCIDDAPQNAYFSFYVLLTGFYRPDFPLELIKAGVPLHGLICVDTSLLGVKQNSSSSLPRFQKRSSEVKSVEIKNFWTVFLKMLWDPNLTFYFKNMIFQVFMPPRFLCDKKRLREFIYREISYLLYDISDLKRQLNNYLDHLKLWNVALKELEVLEVPLEIDGLPAECVSVPVVLQYVIDAVCEVEKARRNSTAKSRSSKSSQPEEFELCSTPSKVGLCGVNGSVSQELEERGDTYLLQACLKTKELDAKYDLYDNIAGYDDSMQTFTETDSTVMCGFHPGECGENMEEALLMSDGIFGSYWKKYQKYVETTYEVDYCLYSLFMTKVFCSYQNKAETSPTRSCFTEEKTSGSELIESVSKRMQISRFTVTEGSRTILHSAPHDARRISQDFFCPRQFKIVSLEKLKASSAPEFRTAPGLRVQTLFTSEVFPGEILKNPFESLRGFVDERLFLNTNDFDFIEFLNKPKLLKKECDHWNNYNCIDHAYSFLDDSLFLMLHNRKDDQNVHHETFNVGLKTSVGLRDFHEYVVEDESEWLENQEELHEIAVFLANKIIESDSFRNISDSEFWLIESLKYQHLTRSEKPKTSEELKTEPSFIEKLMNKVNQIKLNNLRKILVKEELEGYDVSDMAVQFSGLKTVYYSNECSVAVQLLERLYGDQDLGVHVTADSNTLHLYSYVCPEPHVLDPFTFHISYKNGIIVAFGRRFVEVTEETQESIESSTTLKGRKSSSESPEPVVVKQVSRSVKDDEYLYDMAASLPNGLFIRTIRRVVEPCYIKQHYIGKSEEAAKLESSRLFLPNGNVVKMMSNGTVEILKIDTSIVTANLSDLIYDAESENLTLERFAVVSGEGYDRVFQQGRKISSNRVQIFRNTDLETNQVYFRRRDGTNYTLRNDGTLCVQFKDGTRMSSTVLAEVQTESPEDSEEIRGETDSDDDFVLVNFEVTAEHPDYATVVYNTQTRRWKVLLPYDSTITIEPDGRYSVDVDKQTELRVKADYLEMERFSPDRQPLCIFTADLSVFEKAEVATYCRVKDSTGKTFTLENDSGYYIDTPEKDRSSEESPEEISESEQSELVASMDLQTCVSTRADRSNKLSRENKYFVVKRNVTGVELLHRDDVGRELTEGGKGSLIYTLNIPDTERRCFVLIMPKPKKTLKKWEVETVLPNPKYQPNPSPKTTSSTYGVPPSWMHPFPKKKIKFVVPYPLFCRVFVETRKTDLSPKVGTVDNYNYEMQEANQVKHSIIPPNGTEEFLRKLSNDNQDMLKEMYALSMESLINEKKKQKPVNSEKLEHYLELSRYYVELREYHKNCIRYNLVPNYFHHSAGMSWLILNDLLFNLKYSHKQARQIPAKAAVLREEVPPSEISGFSNEEIEYNLSLSAGQSFSDLSCRSNLSARTAPAILQTGGVCRCKVKGADHSASCPVLKFYPRDQTVFEEDLTQPDFRVCSFEEKDVEFELKNFRGKTSLEDLMLLGLV